MKVCSPDLYAEIVWAYDEDAGSPTSSASVSPSS